MHGGVGAGAGGGTYSLVACHIQLAIYHASLSRRGWRGVRGCVWGVDISLSKRGGHGGGGVGRGVGGVGSRVGDRVLVGGRRESEGQRKAGIVRLTLQKKIVGCVPDTGRWYSSSVIASSPSNTPLTFAITFPPKLNPERNNGLLGCLFRVDMS